MNLCQLLFASCVCSKLKHHFKSFIWWELQLLWFCQNTKNKIVDSFHGKAFRNPCDELKFYIKKKLRRKPRRLSLHKAGHLIKLTFWVKLWRLEKRKMMMITKDIFMTFMSVFQFSSETLGLHGYHKMSATSICFPIISISHLQTFHLIQFRSSRFIHIIYWWSTLKSLRVENHRKKVKGNNRQPTRENDDWEETGKCGRKSGPQKRDSELGSCVQLFSGLLCWYNYSWLQGN